MCLAHVHEEISFISIRYKKKHTSVIYTDFSFAPLVISCPVTFYMFLKLHWVMQQNIYMQIPSP